MNTRTTLKSVVTITSCILAAFSSSHAADSTWNVDANGDWATDGNWTALAPGATSGTTNADTATFGSVITADRAITVDANRNILGIDFNANSFGYTLSSGNLLLSDGGLIQTSGTVPNLTIVQTIDSGIQIQGDGGAATFTGGASRAQHTLTLSGAVSGVSTGLNVTTLTLNGTTGNSNNTTQHNLISGIISDGAGGGKLAVVKEGTGVWMLSGNNTFTGGLTVNSGYMRLDGTQSFTGGIVLNGGSLGDNRGNLQPDSLNGNTITVNADASIGTQNTATAYTSDVTLNAGLLTLANNNGNSTWSGAFTGAGGLVIGKLGNGKNNVNVTGTSNTFTGGVEYNNNVNGPATLNVNSFADSASLGAGNIRFGVSGGSSTSARHAFTLASGAITSLTFNNRQFEITGSSWTISEISNNSSQAFTIKTDLQATYTTNPRDLILGGSGSGLGTFDGAIDNNPAAVGSTRNSATITSGTNTAVLRTVEGIEVGASITGSANIPVGTTITAIDYATKTVTLSANVTANVNANTLLTIDGVINSIAVTKSGTGTWVLGGANTYTGGTAMTGGTLTINGSLADSSMTISSGTVNGSGTLTFNVSGSTIDLIEVTGTGQIDISGLAVNVNGTLTDPEYVIVDATAAPGAISGTFSGSPPAGYSFDYGTTDQVKLVSGGAPTGFDAWKVLDGATGVTFDGDTNGDGVKDGLAFLLGAANPNVNAIGLLPTVTEDGSGNLVLTFSCLPTSARGTAVLSVQHSSDLGITDAWAPVAPAALAIVPDSDSTVGGVGFVVTGPSGTPSVNSVTATIPSGEAAGGKLFGRLKATE